MLFSGAAGPAACYFAGISLLAAAATVYDKIAAKTGMRRIRESTLLMIGALGGAAVMLLVMLLNRHKTRHVKFMAGLPAILGLQLGAVFLYARVAGLF